jgi:Ca-activated chloride channel family protein
MILLTDGEHNAGERTPGQAAALAQKWGIKIYTIGFGGSSEGAALLENIAAETGGIYRRATDENSLRAVYREIDRLETTEIESTRFLTLREYFPPFAIAALVLLLLDLLLAHTLFRRLP